MSRRRAERPTVPAPTPTLAEAAAEAHARLASVPLEGPPPAIARRPGPLMCGWCANRHGKAVRHTPCRNETRRCECACTRGETTEPIPVIDFLSGLE